MYFNICEKIRASLDFDLCISFFAHQLSFLNGAWELHSRFSLIHTFTLTNLNLVQTDKH